MNSALHTSTERFWHYNERKQIFSSVHFFESTIMLLGLYVVEKINPQMVGIYRLKFNRIHNNIKTNVTTTIRKKKSSKCLVLRVPILSHVKEGNETFLSSK